MSEYVEFALVGFLFSYLILFLWSVHYETSLFDKGMIMILTGAFFVVFLSAVAGLDTDETRLFVVPEHQKMSFVALVTIAGATFFGAGGSVIANYATEHASDSYKSTRAEEKLSLKYIERKLNAVQRLIVLLIILLILLAFVLGGLVIYFII